MIRSTISASVARQKSNLSTPRNVVVNQWSQSLGILFCSSSTLSLVKWAGLNTDNQMQRQKCSITILTVGNKGGSLKDGEKRTWEHPIFLFFFICSEKEMTFFFHTHITAFICAYWKSQNISSAVSYNHLMPGRLRLSTFRCHEQQSFSCCSPFQSSMWNGDFFSNRKFLCKHSDSPS